MLTLVLVAGLTCPPGWAANGPRIPEDCVWVGKDTMADAQDCGPDGHRHILDLDEHGHYVVNREKGEPDIVFDGLCHDNEGERVMHDPDRKVLPKPKREYHL